MSIPPLSAGSKPAFSAKQAASPAFGAAKPCKDTVNFSGASSAKKPELTRSAEAEQALREENIMKFNDLKDDIDDSGKTLDLKGIDLSGKDLRGVDFKRAHMPESKLNDADLSYSDLKDAKLEKAELKRSNLKGANLAGADIRGADFAGARFDKTYMGGAKTEGAKNIPGGALKDV